MGKRGGGRKGRWGTKKGSGGHRDDKPAGGWENGNGGGYTDIIRENKDFEHYYKLQNFFDGDEEEWKNFKLALQAPLPSTFRITGTKQSAAVFLNMIEKRFLTNALGDIEIAGVDVEAPSPIAFYPDRLAWHYNVARQNIRKSPKLQKFHKFLVAMNEKGYLSRQEAVSMIPPLVLDVKPEHKVLDMCAAPGSKTAQLIELLHAEGPTPTGLVIANDSDNKRCYTLTHQTKRLQSPNFMVTNLDASRFPTIKLPSKEDPTKMEILEFDRVLCDVPCSGDGTLRKNPKAWSRWGQMAAVGLHKLQKRIAYRGAQLLTVGGRLVYSTCSFNPVENEAVVAALLRSTKGSLKLADVSATLPNLVSTPGLSKWVIAEKFGKVLPDFNTTASNLKRQFVRSCFAPTSEEAEWMNLNRCVRVFPHQQDTGGFFIAVFEKTNKLPAQDKLGFATEKKPATDAGNDWLQKLGALFEVVDEKPEEDDHVMTVQRGYKEDPYYFLKDQGEFWPPVKKFYGFDDSFEAENLVARSNSATLRNIYYVSQLVRELVQNNSLATFRIINCGVKVLSRSDAKNKPCDYRICMEGLVTVFPFLNQRVANCTIQDLSRAISQNGAKNEELSESLQASLKLIPIGCMVLSYVPVEKSEGETSEGEGERDDFVVAMETDATPALGCPLQVLIWRADNHVRTLVSKDDRVFFNILLDLPDDVVPQASGEKPATTTTPTTTTNDKTNDTTTTNDKTNDETTTKNDKTNAKTTTTTTTTTTTIDESASAKRDQETLIADDEPSTKRAKLE